VVYPPTGSTAYEREMSTPPTVLLEYSPPLRLTELCDRCVCRSVCLSVCHSVVLSVSWITHERVNGRRLNMVGMDRGWSYKSG